MSKVFLYYALKIVNPPMQIKPVQGFCPAQRVYRELRQLIVAQVEGPQGRCNGPKKIIINLHFVLFFTLRT